MDEKRQIPEGVMDELPAACLRRRQVEEALRRRFIVSGFDEVRTPSLEYYALFGSGAQREGEMIKTFDQQGRILVMRPEFTTPIARLVTGSALSQDLPLRLCYLGAAYDNRHDRAGRRMEFTQAGVELLGLSGPAADAEVIATAIAALLEAGLHDILIDIGQVGFFKGLMEEAGFDAIMTERIRQCVEQKNVLEMQMLLRECKTGDEALQRIMQLPMLYGDESVLDIARGMTRSARSLAALDDIASVVGLLKAYGLKDHIMIDLGMVHAIDYYTGVIFRGLSSHFGGALLSGGRYDTLMESFGMPCPATGFALGVENILEALGRQDAGSYATCAVDIVAYCPMGDAASMRQIEKWRVQGKRVELFHSDDMAQLRKRALVRGGQALCLSEGSVKEL